MKFEAVFVLAFLAVLKDVSKAIVSAKSVPSERVASAIVSLDECSHANSTGECLFGEGRKRKPGKKDGNNGNNVVIIGNDPHQGSSHDIGGFGLAEYYTEDDDDHGKRGKGKKGRKKGKGKKKILKKLTPVFIGLGGMKLLLYHMLMKKMAIATFFSFLLSKVSFILATLVALKQFFHTPVHHRSADSNKLEVVHIPIRKLRTHKDRDKDYDESKFIPVRATYPPELAFDTTPFYHDFPDFNGNNPEAYNDSEEHLSGGTFDDGIYKQGSFNHEDETLNGIYNEHFDDGLDRSDSYNEKTFYKNHVHSPFV